MLPGEALRVERVLASARAFQAVCSLVAIYLDPSEPTRYATLAYALLLVYVVHSLFILIALQIRQESPPAFRLIVHAADTLWPAVITLFTEGPNSPFFVLYLFALLAAAYRWGFRETLATAGAAISVLFVEAILITSGPGYSGQFVEGQFDVNRLIMRATYLLMMGFLLGYLAEKEKQLPAETSMIARIMGKAQAEKGLRGTLQAVLDEVLRLFGAQQAVVATQEASSGRVFLWEGRRTGEARRTGQAEEIQLHSSELGFSQRETYLFSTPCHSWHAVRRRRPQRGEAFDLLALDSEGRRLRNASCAFPDSFLAAHPFRSLLAVSFTFRDEWSGRLFLFDPWVSAARMVEVGFLQALVRQVTPAIYSVYLLRRLRSRAGAMERARVARELHDGAIQSLTAAEMEVDVLRREAAGESIQMAEALLRIQQLLRQEVLNLRELMQQLKPLDLHPKELLDFLADLVEKFRRETGITASFVSELEDVALPPRVCREVARIVQEALANVRKHSAARNVLVRFASQDGNWKLVIDDDGRGFPFSGRFSQAELDASRKGPLVIKERVRSIGGELAVESIPGRGARLEITLPQKAPG